MIVELIFFTLTLFNIRFNHTADTNKKFKMGLYKDKFFN